MRRGWESWDFSAWRRESSEGISSTCTNTWRKSAQTGGAGSFQWCPVTGPEAMGTSWNIGGSLWISGNTFLLWGWLSTGTGCPERFWSLLPWGYSKAIWIRSWATGSRWPCLSRRLDQMTSRGPRQPQPFCDSVLTNSVFYSYFYLSLAFLM